jgi:hypothetical protein
MENYLDLEDVIQRLSDGAFIPKDENNADYQEYLRILSEAQNVN